MKNKNKPAKSNVTILRQICQHIPGHVTIKLARQHGIESRSFSPWSHVVAMLYGHLAGATSLNDICDGLAVNQEALKEIRGASVPSRNGLSHSNRQRDAAMAESLYWAVVEDVCASHQGFATGHGAKNFAYRFKRRVHLVDATTIQLVANCMDWAKHRRRKAALKCHLRLEMESFLPSFVLIGTAHQHEASRARELCADLQAGEIASLRFHLQDGSRQSHLHPARIGLATWHGSIRGITGPERRQGEAGWRQRRRVSQVAGNAANNVEGAPMGRTGQTTRHQRGSIGGLKAGEWGRPDARSAPACPLTLFNTLILSHLDCVCRCSFSIPRLGSGLLPSVAWI
ncbi:MAG TPA: DUF4372 domain-containing protein [Candidatus Saccharimonadales bacterium]|nr:DUF4372 domain-containing protein [Candidatus Saccharimonadales bacterium]